MPKDELAAMALRYAAGELSDTESTAFEARLENEQEAREAVAEAIRLSAAALRQAPPEPGGTCRAAIRERLTGWTPAWLRRRAYRGHPITWAALGALAVAVSTLIGLALAAQGEPAAADDPAAPGAHPPALLAMAQSPGEPEFDEAESIAEIWADLSTPDQIEKLHDEEQKWRQKLRDANVLSGRAVPVSATADLR